ncbi:MAG: hypothetical protein NY202_00805 [Mollicutes bacterium UO1]
MLHQNSASSFSLPRPRKRLTIATIQKNKPAPNKKIVKRVTNPKTRVSQ